MKRNAIYFIIYYRLYVIFVLYCGIIGVALLSNCSLYNKSLNGKSATYEFLIKKIVMSVS